MIEASAATWRSLLYVPGNQERFLSKAQTRGADAIVLDLEDSVPANRKVEARDTVAAHLPKLLEGPADVCIRVNGDLLHLAGDLRATIREGVAAILLPKCQGVEKVRMVAGALDELEAGWKARRRVGLVPLIENPAALPNAYQIAAADPRVVALILGGEDFASACGMRPTEETLRGAKQQIVYAARAAGIPPIGLLGTVAAYGEEGMEALVERSAAFGFSGATSVHPKTIAALNQGFSPSADDIAWAEAVVAGMEEADREGRGAAQLEGVMIDKPVLERARAVLARRR